MFKKFLEMFRKENLLNQAFQRSEEMLASDLEMFDAAVTSLRKRDDARIDIDIYARDQMINAYEREVRRKVITHLALSGERDLAACLTLISVVIDIERIGDFTKNIAELALQHPRTLSCGSFAEDVNRIETTIRTMFRLLLEALPGNDQSKAREVMSEHSWISKRCDSIVAFLIESSEPGLECGEAVTLSLYARYLKRTSAHLGNIASSIVNPFDKIGFRPDEPESKLSE